MGCLLTFLNYTNGFLARDYSRKLNLSAICWARVRWSCLTEEVEGHFGGGELAGEDLCSHDGVCGVGVVHAVPADELAAVLAHPEARPQAAHVGVVVVGRPAIAAARHERLLEP